jgi:hypothetical protein
MAEMSYGYEDWRLRVAGLPQEVIHPYMGRGIDLDAASLSISQSLEQTRPGIAFKQPKTQRGRRTVALPQLAIEALRRHKAQQAAERLAFGPGYQDSGLVFAGLTARQEARRILIYFRGRGPPVVPAACPIS